jgi:hypothetical protein
MARAARCNTAEHKLHYVCYIVLKLSSFHVFTQVMEKEGKEVNV